VPTIQTHPPPFSSPLFSSSVSGWLLAVQVLPHWDSPGVPPPLLFRSLHAERDADDEPGSGHGRRELSVARLLACMPALAPVCPPARLKVTCLHIYRQPLLLCCSPHGADPSSSDILPPLPSLSSASSGCARRRVRVLSAASCRARWAMAA